MAALAPGFGAEGREEEGGDKKALFQKGMGAVEHAHAAVTLRRHGPRGARPAPPCAQLMRKPLGSSNIEISYVEAISDSDCSDFGHNAGRRKLVLLIL
jgi:hypothetical protein